MAKKIQIAELSTKVSADGRPYIQALNAAERETRRKTASMASQWDSFAKNLSRKFSTSSMAKGVLSGLGIGSGMALAQSGANLIVDQFRDAADTAKEIEQSTERQLKLAEEIRAAGQTEKERELYLMKEMERVQARIATLKGTTAQFNIFDPSTWNESFQAKLLDNPMGPTAMKDVNQLTEDLKKLELELTNLRKKMNAEDVQKYEQAMAKLANTEKELLQTIGGPYRANAAPSQNLNLNEARARQLALMSEITQMKDNTDKMTGEDRAKNVEEIIVKTEQLTAVTRVLNKEEERLAQKAEWFGDAISQSFEYAIFSGEKFSGILKSLADDIIRIAFRSAITEPMGKWIGGFFKDLFRADGGPVTGGKPYIVGERGPELFVPSTSGKIEPEVRAGRGGGTYFIDARGADRTGLANLEAAIIALHGSIEQRAVAAVMDAHRRRMTAFA